jgi:hypothetical protein
LKSGFYYKLVFKIKAGDKPEDFGVSAIPELAEGQSNA